MQCTFNLEEINEVAKRLWLKVGTASVLAFHGELGAGKTTFIKALCKAKGVKEVVSSPTFSLINEYTFEDSDGSNRLIYHLDLYRIRDEEEAVRAGIEDCLYSGSLCLVEWPEKISGLLPGDTFHVWLAVAGAARKLTWKNKAL